MSQMSDHFEYRHRLFRRLVLLVLLPNFALILQQPYVNLSSSVSFVVAFSYKSGVQHSRTINVFNDASATLGPGPCRHPLKNAKLNRTRTRSSQDSFVAFNRKAENNLSPTSGVQHTSRGTFLSSAVMMTAMVILMKGDASIASNIIETSGPRQNELILPRNALSASVMSANEETKMTSPLMESISGFVAGGALTLAKTIVKYPLDTATVRLQTNSAYYSVTRPFPLFEDSFRGIVTPLVTNIPAGAVFFAVKDATKQALKQNNYSASSGTGMPKWLSTSLAVAVAQIPYWLVRNPSEVVKTRQQAGVNGYGPDTNAIEAMKKIWAEETPSGLYSGFWENILYAYPADVIKFICYDALSSGKSTLQASEGALYGAMSTAVAQLVTTPLDVVRNRVMAQGYNDTGPSQEETPRKRHSYLGSILYLAQTEGLGGLFAGATPRVGKALLSGAIQFATYEETKASISKSFSGSK